MRQGPMEQTIIESCIRRRQPLPEKIANAPRLLRGLEGYYIAFWELSTDRQVGMGGSGPIPWSAINAWAEREGLSYDHYHELIDMVRAMDTTYRAYQKEQADAHRANEEAKRRAPIGRG